MTEQPAYTRITKLADLIGKTIEAAEGDSACLGLRFTDGTYLFADAIEDDWEGVVLDLEGEMDFSFMRHLGVISAKELHRLISDRLERDRLDSLEARRREYARLKAEFEPG